MFATRVLIGLSLGLSLLCACQSDDGKSKRVEIPRLAIDLPREWQAEQPSSTMRALQARIAGPGGDAELTVFYFGEGKGGDIAENIQRWIDQIQFGPKSSTQREEFSTNGLTVYWVDFSGTLKPDPMGPAREPKPNSRLLGAVIEGPGGPWFFKVIGPDATVGPQRDAFVRMLESAKPRE